MSAFQFDPQERNFPIYGAAERSYPVKEPIDYRPWIVELIYVYSIGKEMVLNEYVDQKVFRTAYRQWVAAKNEQALISFHEAGFFRELQWKRIKHDKMDEKAIDGWFQFDATHQPPATASEVSSEAVGCMRLLALYSLSLNPSCVALNPSDS